MENYNFLKRFQTTNDNCFSTCVANLLFLSDEELNNMPQHHKYEWFDNYQEHLKKYGYQLLNVMCSNKEGLVNFPDILCIISGRSPYSEHIYHSVIGIKGKILFDPRPEGLGILGDFTDWEFCFLISTSYEIRR